MTAVVWLSSPDEIRINHKKVIYDAKLKQICIHLLIFLQAISNPSNQENQATAWHAVVPLVKQLKEFFEFSKQLRKFRFSFLLNCYFYLDNKITLSFVKPPAVD